MISEAVRIGPHQIFLQAYISAVTLSLFLAEITYLRPVLCVFSLQYVSRGVVSASGTLVRTTPALLHLSKKRPPPGVTPPLHPHTDVSVPIMSCTLMYRPDAVMHLNHF